MLPTFTEVFWTSFWSNLFSNLLAAFLITFIIAALIRYYRRPKLDVQLSIAHSVRRDKWLVFQLINKGKTSFMPHEVHWQFYFEHLSGLHSVFETDENVMGIILNNGAFWVANGFNELPCHPDSLIDLANLHVKVGENFPYAWLDEAQFYCSISTNKGTWHPSYSLFRSNIKKIKYEDGPIVRHIYQIEKVII